jgi:hypothetical protein
LFVNQGNLVIGTDTPAKTIKFVAGGTTSNDIIVTISNTGISTSGNVTANYFVGNGSLLTGIVAGNITGQVANALVAGTVYTNAQPNITSVGTLSSLSVTGNGAFGNVNAGNLLTANYSTAVITTGAQPNITSLGTLTSLSVSGNANVGNIGGGLGVYTTLSATGNVTAGNVTLANAAVISANNMQLTTGANTNAGNVTGNFVLTTGSRFQATYA